MQPHRIRLKGPWKYRWISAVSSKQKPTFPPEGTPHMPISWQDLFGKNCGTVRFERRFQQPSNLESHEQVAIAFDGIGGNGTIFLNDEPLGEIVTSKQVQRFDITNRLQPSNMLSVELTCNDDTNFNQPVGLYDTVAIEIAGE